MNKTKVSLLSILLTFIILYSINPSFSSIDTRFEYFNTTNLNTYNLYSTTRYAGQLFTLNESSHSVTSIKLYIKRVGDLTGMRLNISVKNLVTGADPAQCYLSSTDLAFNTTDAQQISTVAGLREFVLNTTELVCLPYTRYAFTVNLNGGNSSNFFISWYQNTSGVAEGFRNNYLTGATPIKFSFGNNPTYYEIWGKIIYINFVSNDTLGLIHKNNTMLINSTQIFASGTEVFNVTSSTINSTVQFDHWVLTNSSSYTINDTSFLFIVGSENITITAYFIPMITGIVEDYSFYFIIAFILLAIGFLIGLLLGKG